MLVHEERIDAGEAQQERYVRECGVEFIQHSGPISRPHSQDHALPPVRVEPTQRCARAWASPWAITTTTHLDLVKTSLEDDLPNLYRNISREMFLHEAGMAGLAGDDRDVAGGVGLADLDTTGTSKFFR